VVILVARFIGEEGEPVVALSFACWQSSHLSNETYSLGRNSEINLVSACSTSVTSILVYLVVCIV